MRSILYFIALVLVIGWLLGFFAFSAGGLIHLLLVFAIIVILLNIIGGRRAV
ncbi:MAG: lmo0937 family membrane protein [Saprospirales bacterium]|nr:MAG: lmo0937 family membrane protein [Saprospirales bacterium]